MKKINAVTAAISAAGCLAIAGCASGGAARTAAQEMRFEYPQDSQHFSENDGAITFSLDVPSGNYDVVIDSDASTVISERIGGIEATAGIKKEGKSFKVAVCDGVLDLSFSGPAHVKSVRIKAEGGKKPNGKPALFVIGDSTARNTANGAKSWGNCVSEGLVPLPEKFGSFSNNAMAGRDSVQFYNQARLEKVLLDIRPGDYVTVNMGINSRENGEVQSFRTIMRDYYIGGIRERGGKPVILLATPDGPYKDDEGNWTNWTSDFDFSANKFKNNRGDGARNGELRKIAEETGCLLIETGQLGEDYLNSLTESDVQAYNKENGTDFRTVLEMVQSWYLDHNHYKEPLGRIIAAYVLSSLSDISETY